MTDDSTCGGGVKPRLHCRECLAVVYRLGKGDRRRDDSHCGWRGPTPPMGLWATRRLSRSPSRGPAPRPSRLVMAARWVMGYAAALVVSGSSRGPAPTQQDLLRFEVSIESHPGKCLADSPPLRLGGVMGDAGYGGRRVALTHNTGGEGVPRRTFGLFPHPAKAAHKIRDWNRILPISSKIVEIHTTVEPNTDTRPYRTEVRVTLLWPATAPQYARRESVGQGAARPSDGRTTQLTSESVTFLLLSPMPEGRLPKSQDRRP